MKKIFLVGALGMLTTGCFRSTGGTEVGIRFNKLTGGEKPVAPGTTTMVFPFLHDWYVFDGRIQTLEMKRDDARRRNDELEFKTRDGNDIGVDVTIIYAIDPNGAATVLRNVASNMDEVRDVLVRPIARSVPRDALNELSSEEFYDSDLRAKKEELALQNLKKALSPYGIDCQRVVLANYRFHDKYQDAINQKKVADQEVNKNRSAAETAIKQWQRELATTKGQVGQQIATEKGKLEQVKLQADAYFESKKLEADAILTEKTANAKGIQKLKEAMSGAGGRTMVKLKIAESLKGKRIVLFPTSDGAMSIQRTDVNQFLETMGLQGEAAPQPATSE